MFAHRLFDRDCNNKWELVTQAVAFNLVIQTEKGRDNVIYLCFQST